MTSRLSDVKTYTANASGSATATSIRAGNAKTYATNKSDSAAAQ